jgi:CheY-like chemotaxis protein
VYRYFFHHDGHDISLLILAAAAAASGSGIVAAGLWIAHAHAPVATAAADAESVNDLPSKSAVETVLVVDDEPDALTAAAELFRNIGYDVVTASTTSRNYV